MKLNVFVASYDHRHGTDVRVFFNESDACKWREEVAKEYWDETIPEDIPRPDNADEAADVYFEHMALQPCCFESFHVEECRSKVPRPPTGTSRRWATTQTNSSATTLSTLAHFEPNFWSPPCQQST